MQVLATLSMNQCIGRLREAGMSIGHASFAKAVDLGMFEDCIFKVSTNPANYIIFAKRLEKWIAELSVDVNPSAEMLAFAEQMEKAAQQEEVTSNA